MTNQDISGGTLIGEYATKDDHYKLVVRRNEPAAITYSIKPKTFALQAEFEKIYTEKTGNPATWQADGSLFLTQHPLSDNMHTDIVMALFAAKQLGQNFHHHDKIFDDIKKAGAKTTPAEPAPPSLIISDPHLNPNRANKIWTPPGFRR